MGIASIIVDIDKIDPIVYSEYIIDPFERIIEALTSRHATDISVEEYPTRIQFSYSDESTIDSIKAYVSLHPFLAFRREFTRTEDGVN